MGRKCKTIVLIVGVCFLALRCNEDIRPIGVAVSDIRPAGGPPGTTVTLTGVNFNVVPEKNVVTVDGLAAEVLSASDTLLTVQLPQQASFGIAELILTSAGLLSDTAQVIVSENPLAEITDISPASGPAGTIVTIVGRNFNPDITSYAVLYEEPDGTFFIPQNEDGTYRSTLQEVYTDSLFIQIPEGFVRGRIRILTGTVGKPEKTTYELFTPVFTVL